MTFRTAWAAFRTLFSFRERAKLRALTREYESLERLNRKVRAIPGHTTALMMQNLSKIGQRMHELRWEIKKLRDKQ